MLLTVIIASQVNPAVTLSPAAMFAAGLAAPLLELAAIFILRYIPRPEARDG